MKTPGGLGDGSTRHRSVKTALLHGLQEVFFLGAVLMAVAVLPHLFLRREPLRRALPQPTHRPQLPSIDAGI
jgi:hypothetical protein